MRQLADKYKGNLFFVSQFDYLQTLRADINIVDSRVLVLVSNDVHKVVVHFDHMYLLASCLKNELGYTLRL